jgi:hypothetical protein
MTRYIDTVDLLSLTVIVTVGLLLLAGPLP